MILDSGEMRRVAVEELCLELDKHTGCVGEIPVLASDTREDLEPLLSLKNLNRTNTPAEEEPLLNTGEEYFATTDPTKYNIKNERIFKLKVLEWLTDGKPKIFRSSTEGNYSDRLLNCSLTPMDQLGRMLHSFSCTAYEVAEFTYENLVKYGKGFEGVSS